MAKLRTLSILLSLLVPVHSTRSPDCGGILTPLGLSYFAEVSKPHAETVLRQDLLAPTVPDLLVGSTKPSRTQINSVKVTELSLSLVPDSGLRLSVDVDLSITPAPSTTKVMRLAIRADLHVEMNPEGNLEVVTSACKPTMEEVQSTKEMERLILWFSLLWDLGNGGKQETEARAFLGRKIQDTHLPLTHLSWGSPNFFHSVFPSSKSSSSELDKEINVDKVCLEVSKLLLSPNEELISLTAQFPVSPSCQLQYLPLAAPVFSKQGITISLQTTFQVAGMAIPLPVSPVPFNMPELASSSPAHLTLAFSEHFFSSLFFALEMAGAFNMTILSPLTTATVAPKITQMGSLFPEDLPVVLQAVFRSSTRVVLEEGKAALKLLLTVHVGAGSPAFQSFLSVNVVSVPCEAQQRLPSMHGAGCEELVAGGSTQWAQHIPLLKAEAGPLDPSDPSLSSTHAGYVCRTPSQRHQHEDDNLRTSDRGKSGCSRLPRPYPGTKPPGPALTRGAGGKSLLITSTSCSTLFSRNVELSLAASDVGPVPDALLEELFLPTIRTEVPAQINVVLSEGVVLPHISSFTYTNINVVIHKDYVLVPCNLQLQARTGAQTTTNEFALAKNWYQYRCPALTFN
ncbi:protein TENP-like [Guaruba guarouba]